MSTRGQLQCLQEKHRGIVFGFSEERKPSLSTVKGEHSKVLDESARDHFGVDLPRMSFLLEQGTKKIIAIMMLIMIMYGCYQSKMQV